MESFSVPCPKTLSLPRLRSGVKDSNTHQHTMLSLHRGFSPRPCALHGSFLGDPSHNLKQSRDWKMCAKLNEVTAEKSSNSAPVLSTKYGAPSSEGKVDSSHPVRDTVPNESSISAFMAQVSDLIKLVGSRDIAELQLKQLGCEILIRKKEALQQAAPVASMTPPLTHVMLPSPLPPATAAASASANPPSASAPALPAPAKANTSSHPPLKCPMAGTFYRCPAPGEPPFVKVGDKVQKGQIVCIIEAMKLMNEIEADQSGTLTEILVEDTKPVSVDTPLFVIVP
ncbi:biotin carboxyl carrier protein of acetyl-CoA carboxylase 2, chloroplastic-like [Juglans microcarpa x Juglans regia]|uniref:biotin carboxyl carrier protein of acetyl-CoA carboxylase 2, chloroplastic-like n=1 Tax=Juglans microcarpa x Juglans regia TaxID=2249226 RepID=UPI001B7E2A1E|nr:biotin carboxyl carrier protein of acetyl-CoA carboxylase 2, chloroplastic-like [Juglans microcarpa x Juglans regia]